MTCEDDAQSATSGAIAASVTGLPKAIQSTTVTYQQGYLDMCKTWDVAPVTQAAKAVVTSDIPALLLGREYDPITPPANVAAAGAMLSHSFGFVFPGAGHAVRYTSKCAEAIVNTFYDDLATRPDGSCIATLKEPFS
jgi:pimeloyl-ACP methyl ester carboxylesterase